MLPTHVLAFIEEAVGPVHSAVDCSWPRENSRVWRIVAGREERTWYVKQHPTPKFHAREVEAYTRWTSALGPGRVPELQAASTDLAAILVTEVPGFSPYHHKPSADEECQIHRQLGELLGAFHHSGPPRSPVGPSPVLGKVQRHLTAAEPHLTPEAVDHSPRRAGTVAARPHPRRRPDPKHDLEP